MLLVATVASRSSLPGCACEQYRNGASPADEKVCRMRPSGWLCQPANTDDPGQPLCPSDFSPCTHLLPPPDEAELARIHRPPPAAAPVASSAGHISVVAVAWGDERRPSSRGDPAAAMHALAAHRALPSPSPPPPPDEAALRSPPPPRPPWWLIGDEGGGGAASQRPEQSVSTTTQPASVAGVAASASLAGVPSPRPPPLLLVGHAEAGHARAAVSTLVAQVEPTSPKDAEASSAFVPAVVASLLDQPVYLGLLLSVAGLLGCAMPARRRGGGGRVGGDADAGSASASLTCAADDSYFRGKPRHGWSSSRKVMRKVGARGGGGKQMAVALPRTEVAELEADADGAETIWL